MRRTARTGPRWGLRCILHRDPRAEVLSLEAGQLVPAAGVSGPGGQPPQPSSSHMAAQATDSLHEGRWAVLFEGLAIFSTVLRHDLLGQGFPGAPGAKLGA